MGQTRSKDELASALTHAAGVVASLAGGAVLITLAALSGSVYQIVGAAVFAASLVLLYSASTAYHIALGERVKHRLKIFDHCAIYVLIAGTYTPLTLTALRGPWGWTLFGVVWGLAVAGIIFKLFFIGRFPRVSTAIYIGMGWLVVVAAGPLVRAVDPVALAWLVGGGLAYTGGTVFYHSRRIPYAHAVWHLFVLTGSVCHAIAVGIQI
ncbi:MAG TPA: hemolysin III family protein [Longimicrobiales bacterium]|nr:hemolysin III family protein [Longimicrobiales bacterium]